jgi:hypothetical protein
MGVRRARRGIVQGRFVDFAVVEGGAAARLAKMGEKESERRARPFWRPRALVATTTTATCSSSTRAHSSNKNNEGVFLRHTNVFFSRHPSGLVVLIALFMAEAGGRPALSRFLRLVPAPRSKNQKKGGRGVSRLAL